MASICCSPPESVPARWLPPFAQNREELVQKLTHRGVGPRTEEGPDAQVFLDGEAGKDASPLRHDAHAGWERRCALIPVTSAPSSSTRPCAIGVRPTSPRASVVLPTPLRPSKATTSPASTVSETPWTTGDGP